MVLKDTTAYTSRRFLTYLSVLKNLCKLGLATAKDCSKPEKIIFESENLITKVDTGLSHTAFIDRRGCVLLCGKNESG